MSVGYGTPRSKIGGPTAQIFKTAKILRRDILRLHTAPNSKTHKTPKTHGKRAALAAGGASPQNAPKQARGRAGWVRALLA